MYLMHLVESLVVHIFCSKILRSCPGWKQIIAVKAELMPMKATEHCVTEGLAEPNNQKPNFMTGIECAPKRCKPKMELHMQMFSHLAVYPTGSSWIAVRCVPPHHPSPSRYRREGCHVNEMNPLEWSQVCTPD